MEIRINFDNGYGTFRNLKWFTEFANRIEDIAKIVDNDMQELKIDFYRTKKDYCQGVIADIYKFRDFHKELSEFVEIWNKVDELNGVA